MTAMYVWLAHRSKEPNRGTGSAVTLHLVDARTQAVACRHAQLRTDDGWGRATKADLPRCGRCRLVERRLRAGR